MRGGKLPRIFFVYFMVDIFVNYGVVMDVKVLLILKIIDYGNNYFDCQCDIDCSDCNYRRCL